MHVQWRTNRERGKRITNSEWGINVKQCRSESQSESESDDDDDDDDEEDAYGL